MITRVTAWLRLSRREGAWKIAEILILRHQLLVLQRQPAARPKLAWADRALLVTPDTILRSHRDIVRRRWANRSMRGRTGWPTTRRNIKALVLRLARENTDTAEQDQPGAEPGEDQVKQAKGHG